LKPSFSQPQSLVEVLGATLRQQISFSWQLPLVQVVFVKIELWLVLIIKKKKLAVTFLPVSY